jgi:regulator of protease activity HflC (stomatin/prohibitin superfamily)
MDQIVSLIRQFIDLFRFWIIVSPWEQAVRVRLGKHVKVLHSGIHFRLSILDSVFLQSTRQRVCTTDRQTLTTSDAKTVTITASVGYSIENIYTLYNTLHHADDTIRNIVRSRIASTISRTRSDELSCLEALSRNISKDVSLAQFGLSEVVVYVIEIALVKTYRLIGDYAQSYVNGTSLSTEKATEAVK